ncbi:hypothetical protein XENOCAPTIV_029279 [Xenoophorus captivus]|uniref:Uncharacterized protein n=1 Tax=Xenoophorus captivus TaxID=1517983 RepID=A0ABV0SER2_9TELE
MSSGLRLFLPSQLQKRSDRVLLTPLLAYLQKIHSVLLDDLVKLTEKCGLSSPGSSPVVTPLRTPEDLKSNILKAQVEAAALKVRIRLQGSR